MSPHKSSEDLKFSSCSEYLFSGSGFHSLHLEHCPIYSNLEAKQSSKLGLFYLAFGGRWMALLIELRQKGNLV
jgi:hypothetical protein